MVASDSLGAEAEELCLMEAFLERIELNKYLPALRELGLERFSDFEEIEDQDLEDMGMSTLKKRRLRRALQEEAEGFGITPHRIQFEGGPDLEGGEKEEESGCTSIWWYFLGTMATQIGQSSMLVLSPLIAIHITGSTAIGAAAGTAAAGCAAVGQLLFIPLLIRFDLRHLLLITMTWKVIMLAVLVYLYQHAEDYHGTAKHIVSAIVFTLCMADSVPRGGIDSLRNVIPMIYHGGDQEALSNFYAKFQFAYNIAMCIGPAMLGFSLQFNRFAATYMVCASYIVAVCCFYFMPSVAYNKEIADEAKDKKKDKKKVGFWNMCSGSFAKLKHPLVLVPFIGGINVQGQRLKGIYATIFAKGLLLEETGHTAGYIVSAQGAGGIIGAVVAGRYATSCATQYWFFFGILVVFMRTWGWTTSIEVLDNGGTTNQAAIPFVMITFLYGFANMITINVMVSLLNARAQSVEIMGLSRFLVRMSGVFTKMGVTFVVGKYELIAALDGKPTDYRAMFGTMSLAITVIFCLPAFCCFLHMCMFSGVGMEDNYPPIGGDYESVEGEEAAEGEGIEMKDVKSYGATDDSGESAAK